MQDFTEQLAALRARLAEAAGYLRIDELRARQPQLEAEASRPDLWDDPDAGHERSPASWRRSTTTSSSSTGSTSRRRRRRDAATSWPARRATSRSRREIADGDRRASTPQLDELELRSLFTGEYDDRDAVCHIKSGEGGTDAQDWAEMLLRMYNRWAEQRGFDVEIDGGHRGHRGRALLGRVHRARAATPTACCRPSTACTGWCGSRRSTTRASARRRSPSVQVVPFFEEVADEVEIDEKDLRIDTYRSSGAGGQHVNVTDSAVRITHLPDRHRRVAARTSAASTRTRTGPCRCWRPELLDLERQKREDELAGIAGEQPRRSASAARSAPT